MRFSYAFNNLLGSVYTKGDLLFTPDGNSIISPVGNRISIFDLKSNKTSTISTANRHDFVALDLSPNGCLLFAVDESLLGVMISLVSHTEVHRMKFGSSVNGVKFSPNGKYLAALIGQSVDIFRCPGVYEGEFNSFLQLNTFHIGYEIIKSIDWSPNSEYLVSGSLDTNLRVFPVTKKKGLNFITTVGNPVLKCYFDNSYNIICLTTQHIIRFKALIDFEQTDKEPDFKVMRANKVNDDDDDNDLVDLHQPAAEFQKTEVAIFKKVLQKNIPFRNRLTASAYHKKTNILVTGHQAGTFHIFDMPLVNLIHSLNVSTNYIRSLTLNQSGDWIGIGCDQGQLVVWEWQSEMYVMKQQAHANDMTCMSYSPDARHIATGGRDGRVKIWQLSTGFCFVTFSDHTAPVTAVAFATAKNILASAGGDGTVRLYDMFRYRNFNLFATPTPAQLHSVSMDAAGELVAASSSLEIYLWSIKGGKLLEVLSGHTEPISGIEFSPSPLNSLLVSTSWDKTLKIWNTIECSGQSENVQLFTEGVCLTFRPDGLEVAVGTLDGQISIYDVESGDQTKSIDSKYDIIGGLKDTDVTTLQDAPRGKCFQSLCYSADGEYILAGGQTKYVSIYNAKQAILVKRFEISINFSYDGVQEFFTHRHMTDFGNVALVEMRQTGDRKSVQIPLPGIARSDPGQRNFKKEVRVFSLQFSPTGEQWAAASSEGLLIYSLDSGQKGFDPWQLDIDVTPNAAKTALKKGDFTNALILAMKLNESALINEIMESIPPISVALIIQNLALPFIERLLIIVASSLDNSKHLEFYLIWSQNILKYHGQQLKGQKNLAALIQLQKSLTMKYECLSKICDYNKFTMEYVTLLGQVKSIELKNEND